jgi:NADH-quinone oxidoreductase subunit G
MAKVTVDGIEVEVPNGASVLQACEAAGREIPRFCYHERLSVAGNCRMCLVEVEKAPKPVASCAFPVNDGMKVFTDSEVVRRARRGVMEFLLINHPLDCPICDQGGECDLQDQAVGYGLDHSRYLEEKRAVKDKYMGPLVKTVMTRCIQCTRCIRFATEVAGVPELGATNRGENMEIGTYVEKALTTELSGNLIDICPVGALTSRPYAFVSRPWELRKTDSIDVLDATGTNIRIDVRGGEVLRLLPRANDAVNEEWLADRGRFAFDGLKRRRLDRPWVRRDGKLMPASWHEAFEAITAKLTGLAGAEIGAVVGPLVDAESTIALRDLMAAFGSENLECRTDGAAIDTTRRDFYTFNAGIAGIDQADALLIIGSNPRTEAPVINARIRKRANSGGFPVGFIGPQGIDLTYPTEWIGSGGAALRAVATGDHPFAARLRAARRPMLIIGRGALARDDGAAVLAAAWRIAAECNMLQTDWHGFNMLHQFGGQVAPLDLGFVGGRIDGLKVLWSLGAEPRHLPLDAFVIFQGHHGEAAAARADVILPGAAYTEKDALWTNTEGRIQEGRLAVYPPGEAREDWKIIRAISEILGKPLSYDSQDAVRARLVHANPVFGTVGFASHGCTDTRGPNGDPGMVTDAPFALPFASYWLTDPISRASATMAECAAVYDTRRSLAAE